MLEEIEEIVERPRIREVFVSGTDETVPASRYLESDRRDFAAIRLDFETAILKHEPIARCAACHRPVKPRLHYKYNRRYFKHHGGDAGCPYKTKGEVSQRQIDAMRYNGQKEGPEHIRLKGLLVVSLECDASFEDILVEKRWWGALDPEKWKKPDVAARHLKLPPIAFEVQLSTTFLNVMADRRKFYQENGALLVWIFKDVRKDERRQFQDDIFYNNNSNLFVVDDETALLSLERSALVLRCHYIVPVLSGTEIHEEWREELVEFSQLTADQENQRVFFFDFNEAYQKLKNGADAAADADLRERFLRYWSGLGLDACCPEGLSGDWPVVWNQMAGDFARRGVKLPVDRPDYDLARFCCLTFSTYYGKSIGFAYRTESFIQVANYAFDNCKDLLWYFGDLLLRTGHWKAIHAHYHGGDKKKLKGGKQAAGWEVKWQVVKAVYRENDPAYPQKRQFDELFGFLF